MGCGASSATAVESINVPVSAKVAGPEVIPGHSGRKQAPKPVAPTKVSETPSKEDSELEMLSTKTHSMSAALVSGAHVGSLHDNYVLGKTLGEEP